jgi:hypothetical protein
LIQQERDTTGEIREKEERLLDGKIIRRIDPASGQLPDVVHRMKNAVD